MKRAICVGINNYPGTVNDLSGCVNDVNDWAKLLNSFGFQTTKIFNEQATKNNILNALENLVKEAKLGDVVVFTYSGHGTQVLDTSGDEEDGYDEALYVYDGTLIDDEINAILKTADKNAEIIVIADSCFSGTVTKALALKAAKRRFVKTDTIPPTAVLKNRFLAKATEENMLEILISGCSDKEYSYDAFINGRWNGAMTAFATSIIKPEQTYNEFYSKLREKLPSEEYPQTPQLEGSEANKNKLVFTEKTDSGAGSCETGGGTDTGTGTGSGDGVTGSSGCLSMLLVHISVISVVLLILQVIIPH
ncbi:MAG: caspase family protein [Bacteroidales bacterium]|nr:caspase family protein [Bacteroidales bacterium]